MRKISLSALGLAFLALSAFPATASGAEESKAVSSPVTKVTTAGPYVVRAPFMVDAVDVNGKSFGPESVMETPVDLESVFASDAETLSSSDGSYSFQGTSAGSYSLNVLGFKFSTNAFGHVQVEVSGLENSKVYIDGQEGAGADLRPGTHEAVVKGIGSKARLSVSAKPEVGFSLEDSADESGRYYTLRDVMEGRHFGGSSLSPSGKYMIVSYTTTYPGGRTARSAKVTELSSGNVVAEGRGGMKWLNTEDKYYSVEDGKMVVTDPATGRSEVRATGIPDGYSVLSPNDDYFIFMLTKEGPKEREDIYEIVDPEDRQPGWRNRSCLAKYDIAGGVMQPLTYGYHDTYLSDISADGKHILFSVRRQQTARPTSLTDIYDMDLETMNVTKIVDGDGFVGSASYSPDGRSILFSGTPESFGGIGANVLKWQTPSMTDYQLYLLDHIGGKVKPLTKNFDPNVQNVVWSKADGNIYFTAENKDSVSLYRLRPGSGKISMVKLPEEMVLSFSIAGNAPVMAFGGQGSMNSDRIYTVDLKSDAVTLREDLSAELLKGVTLGECHNWNFKDKDGYEIYGRYYLPPHFDASKKYPLIVNYYGGCSPTGRNFESRYPWHLYAAMGYVVYVVNPRGATGFGQEFSAYHVDTAGDYVSDDIIEGTKKFVKEHSFVDASKIGCIGASYGGFMTQWLQTKTDIFAAAISHAGISDHTSYWGNGYWGYSYSEVSMANAYPWNRKDLYVDHSPLYNADKIHTPLLFIQGNSDTNVPPMESVQMFTALKLLDRPTALVFVDGQDHHILDYDKRMRWQDTIFAWFQKWLKGDSSWWESMYPDKNL